MNRPVKHLFIINPRSFWNKWKMEEVIDKIFIYFKGEDSGKEREVRALADNEEFKVSISQFPRDAMGIVRYYAGRLPEGTALRVYAVGGDGILFDCLNGIIGLKNAELGAIPYGRSNDFVRGFGRQNKSLFRDIALQVNAPAVPMDVIRAGNNYALNFCTTGITSLAFLYTQNFAGSLERSSRLVQWLARKLYRHISWIASFPALFNKAVLQQPCEVTIDGEQFEDTFRGMLLSNGAFYAAGKHPAPNAMPNDGLLDVVLARGADPLRFLRQLPSYMRGRQKKFPKDFILRRAKKIVMHSAEPLLIALDDQVFFDTSLTAELLPQALWFVDVTGQGYQGVIPND